MTVYEFGDETKPAIMLLPGTCCYWKRTSARLSRCFRRRSGCAWCPTTVSTRPKPSAGLPDPGAARFPPIQEKLTVLMPVNL